MSNRVKKLVYWLSVVGPTFDIIYGAIIGIRNAWTIARTEREHNARVKKETELFFKFREDNNNE